MWEEAAQASHVLLDVSNMVPRDLPEVVRTFPMRPEVEQFVRDTGYWQAWIDSLKRAKQQPKEVQELEEDMGSTTEAYLKAKANTLQFAFDWAVCSPRELGSTWTSYLLFRRPQTKIIYLVRQASAAILTDWDELAGDLVQLACYRNIAQSIRPDGRASMR
jgi:hypothetical protein